MFNEMMRAEIWLQETLASGESLEELAARLGYSSSQVRRRFRQCFGISPSAYRESLRLEKAARLLTFTPRGVREIAGRCGYTNHSAFSRAFQRRYRQTPREFRLNRHRALRASRSPALTLEPTLHTLPPRTAVVTRCYVGTEQLTPPETWPRMLWGEEPPSGIPMDAPSLALLHDPCQACSLPKLDLGVVLAPGLADSLAMPPSLRVVTLPSVRTASLSLTAVDDVNTALESLLTDALPTLGEHYSGEAIRLIADGDALELQLPLMPPPQTKTAP